MITTVTMNPCNDKTVEIPQFIYGGMNRVVSQSFGLSGKGFNVSKGVSRLGCESVATGFLYDDNGMQTQVSLESDNVQVDCIWLPGSIRTNLKILDQGTSTITEINEEGVEADDETLNKLYDKIFEWAKQSEYIVLSGSLPPGAPKDSYGKIIERCRPFCRMVLDAEGEVLLKGIVKKPFMIKPNQFELEMAVGTTLPTIEYIKEAAMSIIREGVGVVAVSLGADGALITDGDVTYYAPAVKSAKVLGTVGAGDSMVAGFCAGFKNDLELRDVFKLGVAAATACVSKPGIELVDMETMQEYYEDVIIEEI